MAKIPSALGVMLLASAAACAAADSFLKSRPDQVDKEEVKQLLLAELAGRADRKNLQDIEVFMKPLFASLPKNVLGRLDAPLVRYALHRYFVQKYGWHVKGLDGTWSHNQTESPTTVLKSRAPAYIQSLFEEHLHGRGFGLHELSVFAATLGDLIHAEAVGKLQSIHRVMELPTVGFLPKEDADSAVLSFLVAYLLGGTSRTAESTADLELMRRKIYRQYPEYPETEMWFHDFRLTTDWRQEMRRNPFVESHGTFADSVSLVLDFSHTFGSYQSLECHTLKRKLIDMEFLGTGRVRLADFYSNALNGGWEFMESYQYLHNQGALDETNPSRPLVIIPNYINSLTNCLTASNFYAICCVNECNSLMSQLEKSLEAPMAPPAQIARVVSGLHSDTVDAPRNLSSTLLARLAEIANYHGGSVPLHGRLFAQWMHHAYPRECQYPHVKGSFNPLTPEEFARARGVKSLEATSEEMESHAAWSNESSTMKGLPWTRVEEELAVDMYSTVNDGRSGLSTVAAFAALITFALPMCRALRDALSGPGMPKVDAHLV